MMTSGNHIVLTSVNSASEIKQVNGPGITFYAFQSLFYLLNDSNQVDRARILVALMHTEENSTKPFSFLGSALTLSSFN